VKYCAQCVKNTAQHIQRFHLLNKEQLQGADDDNPSFSEDHSSTKPRMGRTSKVLIESDDESDKTSSDDENNKASSPHPQSKSTTYVLSSDLFLSSH
jgi:hypothetical protein